MVAQEKLRDRQAELVRALKSLDMTGAVKEKYDRLIAAGLTPIKRWGQPEDVARAVLALAEGYFPFSTGEVINVDGGFHKERPEQAALTEIKRKK